MIRSEQTKPRSVLSSEEKNRFWVKHVHGAIVRTIGGGLLAGLVILFYRCGYIGPGPCKGGVISSLFLVCMSIPSLYAAKVITRRSAFNITTILVNILEIGAFTSVIYFMGGVHAAFLLPCYTIVITRVGSVAPKRYPYIIAALSILAFTLMILARNVGLLPAQDVYYPLSQDWIYDGLIILVASGSLMGVAAITSFSSGILKKARNAMVEKNRELEASREKLTNYSRSLEQSERKYRRVFQSIQTVYMEVDKKGIIREISPSVERITGIKRKSILGKTIFQAPYVYPDRIYFLAKDVLETGEVHDREIPVFHTSGRVLTLSISARTLKDHYRLEGCVAVDIIDVTSRHMAQTALRESEERYRMLIEELQDVVFMIKPDGYIEYTSTAAMDFGGYTPEESVNRHFSDFIDGDEDLIYATNLLAELLTDKKTMSAELRYKPKSDPPFFVEVSATPIIMAGEVSGVLCIMRDISQRKKAEEQVRHLNQELMNIQEKERKRIALDLHDDVAQNLASLMLNCETFFDRHPETPSDLKEKMKHVSSVLKESLNFVRNLAYELRPPGLDQLGLIKTLSRYCDDFSDKHNIRVEFHSVGMGAFVFDPDTEINLYRLVQEALNNVRKHACASHVVVKFTASVPDIFLRIIDNGSGFNVDERLPSALNEKRMGIHSMTERVNFMGGKIKVLSRADQGTTIRVTIPGERFRISYQEISSL